MKKNYLLLLLTSFVAADPELYFIEPQDGKTYSTPVSVKFGLKDFGVAPSRMTAAGRSYYLPVADNDTASNRAKNRRTRIVVLPKLDQFYDLIDQGMQSAQ